MNFSISMHYKADHHRLKKLIKKKECGTRYDYTYRLSVITPSFQGLVF